MTIANRFPKVTMALLLVTLAGQIVSAQKLPPPQKWEYCAITSSAFTKFVAEGDTTAGGVASICYFQNGGCRREEVKFDLDLAEFRRTFSPNENQGYVNSTAAAKAAEGALSRAITKLGDDGWELVGEAVFSFSPDTTKGAIYFKRRK